MLYAIKTTDPDTHGQLIFYKGDKNVKWEKEFFSASGAEKPGQPHVNQ